MPEEVKKNFPQAAPEIAETLGFSGTDKSKASTIAPPADLPGVNDIEVDSKVEAPTDADIEADIEAIKGKKSPTTSILRISKLIAPYVAVFAVGVFLYYYYFTNFSLYNIEKKPQAQTEQANVGSTKERFDQLLLSERGSYNAWIDQFYFDVSDLTIVDPLTDNSGNGLNNFQKYLLGLNPRAYDTLGLGMSDSDALRQGVNPLTGSALTDYQKQVIEQYLNLEGIAEKTESKVPEEIASNLPVAQAATSATAPASTVTSKPQVKPSTGTRSNPTSVNYKPAQVNGVTVNQSVVQPLFNKFGLDASKTNNLNIDFSKPALLEIPIMGKSVPVIWTQGAGTDLDLITKELNNGVVHLPNTALPGDLGRSYISGHSSGYAWDTSKYKDIFRNLSLMETSGSKFYLTVYTKDGKAVKLTYSTYGYHIYEPGDQAQFESTADSEVALSTCWPIGGTKQRLVVFAKLIEVNK